MVNESVVDKILKSEVHHPEMKFLNGGGGGGGEAGGGSEIHRTLNAQIVSWAPVRFRTWPRTTLD